MWGPSIYPPYYPPTNNSSNPMKDWMQFQKWMERKEETKAKKEEEKKKKDGDKKKEGLTTAELFVVLTLSSPIIVLCYTWLMVTLINKIH